MGIFLKDPAARLDYAVDWSSSYLNGTSPRASSSGATITASDWHVDPAEASGIAVSATLTAPARTGATLDGGISGHVYRIANQITLNDGRRDERTLSVRVETR